MINLRVLQGRLDTPGVGPEDHELLITLRDLWEERAGILEYEAGMPREEAEQRAWSCCLGCLTAITQSFSAVISSIMTKQTSSPGQKGIDMVE